MKKPNSKTEYIKSIEVQVLLISKLGMIAKLMGHIELANICAYFVHDVLDWIRLQKMDESESFSVYPIEGFSSVEKFVEKYQADAA